MASNYTLQPDEWVVIEGEPGAYHRAPSGRMSSSTLAIVLTNRNIILVTSSPRGRPKGVRYFPLNHIIIASDHPRITQTSRGGLNLLEIHFQGGVETFAFRRKKELIAWSDIISKLLSGDTDGFSAASNRAIPGVAAVAGSLKDTFGAVKSSLGLESGSKPKPVAGKCTSCGAPVSGKSGGVVRCRYCDSNQQM